MLNPWKLLTRDCHLFLTKTRLTDINQRPKGKFCFISANVTSQDQRVNHKCKHELIGKVYGNPNRHPTPKTEHSSKIAISGIFGLEAYGPLRSEILPISKNKDIVKLLLDPHSLSKFRFSYKFFTRTMYCSNCFHT